MLCWLQNWDHWIFYDFKLKMNDKSCSAFVREPILLLQPLHFILYTSNLNEKTYDAIAIVMWKYPWNKHAALIPHSHICWMLFLFCIISNVSFHLLFIIVSSLINKMFLIAHKINGIIRDCSVFLFIFMIFGPFIA